MKCTNCGANNASFHYKSNINGKLTELHLCADCARELDHTGFTQEPHDYFSSMLQGFFAPAATPRSGGLCPLCGASARDIRASGKVGCASCYTSFPELLDPYIRRIHGSAEHSGKVPHGLDIRQKAKRELRRLQRELDEAIEREDFETAVILRDQIREYREASENE